MTLARRSFLNVPPKLCATGILALGLLTSAGAQQIASLPAAALTQPVAPDLSYRLIDAPSFVASNSSRPPEISASDSTSDATLDESSPAASAVKSQTHEAHVVSERERNERCETGELRGKPCRVQWGRVAAESFFFLSSQHLGNIAMDVDTRNEVFHGSFRQVGFWGDYVYCVEHYRWNRWKDDDPFFVDYVGHPMMGAVTNSIYEQNDPKQRALSFENTHRYWMGRLRATAYTSLYSAQWKVGPLSEASIGNTGILYYYSTRIHAYTNETGMQDFFVTPIGGLAWNVGEDVLDRYLLARLRHKTHNRVALFFSAFATPGKSSANIARFRAPYYRDTDITGVDAATGHERLPAPPPAVPPAATPDTPPPPAI
jgi:hypothetical protein